MEYILFISGVIALIVAIIINSKSTFRSKEEQELFKADILEDVSSRFAMLQDFDTTLIQKFASMEQVVNALKTRICEAEDDIESRESECLDLRDDFDGLEDNVRELENDYARLRDEIDIKDSTLSYLKEDFDIYLQNDLPVIKHFGAADYDIAEAVMFMALVLQDLKDKINERKETKRTKHSKGKKVSVSGDTVAPVNGKQST